MDKEQDVASLEDLNQLIETFDEHNSLKTLIGICYKKSYKYQLSKYSFVIKWFAKFVRKMEIDNFLVESVVTWETTRQFVTEIYRDSYALMLIEIIVANVDTPALSRDKQFYSLLCLQDRRVTTYKN
jgi:hypothetical protein